MRNVVPHLISPGDVSWTGFLYGGKDEGDNAHIYWERKGVGRVILLYIPSSLVSLFSVSVLIMLLLYPKKEKENASHGRHCQMFSNICLDLKLFIAHSSLWRLQPADPFGWGYVQENSCRIAFFAMVIGLVTVFDAILTSRQAREKLQCLYENALKKKIYEL